MQVSFTESICLVLDCQESAFKVPLAKRKPPLSLTQGPHVPPLRHLFIQTLSQSASPSQPPRARLLQPHASLLSQRLQARSASGPLHWPVRLPSAICVAPSLPFSRSWLRCHCVREGLMVTTPPLSPLPLTSRIFFTCCIVHLSYQHCLIRFTYLQVCFLFLPSRMQAP